MAQQDNFHIIPNNNFGHLVIYSNLYILFNSQFLGQNALLTVTAIILKKWEII